MSIRIIGVFFFGIFLFALPTASADTIHVPKDLDTIMSAIHAASEQDVILVKPGTYTENINFLGKQISLISEEGPEVTWIDGDQAGSVVTFENNEKEQTLLQGFTLTNGSGTALGNGFSGGGIFCVGASPTIQENIITGNDVEYGGGGILCKDRSKAKIIKNQIVDNEAGYHGGGILCMEYSSPLITKNTIALNRAGYSVMENGSASLFDYSIDPTYDVEISPEYSGGGIHCHASAAEVTYNDIYGNEGAQHGGGVLFCLRATPKTPKLYYNIIHDNFADKGSGVYTGHVSPIIFENQIFNNVCTNYGGGICCRDGSSRIENNIIHSNEAPYGGGIALDHVEPTVVNNIIYSNSGTWGGGILVQNAKPTISNNTLFGNDAVQGGGICCTLDSEPRITNTILWDDTAEQGNEIWLGDSQAPSVMNISYSDVEGGQVAVHVEDNCSLVWGENMMSADPLFVNPQGGDFHLLFSSPCRDRGSNSAPSLPSMDPDGNKRIYNTLVDIGAYEFCSYFYITGNATPGGNITGKLIGVPGANPVGLFIGSGVLGIPLKTPYGDLFLQQPWLVIPLLPLPSNGLILLPSHVPQSPPAPYDVPLQALIGDKLTILFLLRVRS